MERDGPKVREEVSPRSGRRWPQGQGGGGPKGHGGGVPKGQGDVPKVREEAAPLSGRRRPHGQGGGIPKVREEVSPPPRSPFPAPQAQKDSPQHPDGRPRSSHLHS